MRMRSVSFGIFLLLLAALHVALLPSGRAAAQAPDPLTLTVTAERSECTAGTLNPVTWEISGGTPPYTLTIDGAAVDAGAEGAAVTCGALSEGATAAPATISAVVTDAAGGAATASAGYAIVPPFHGPLFSERTAGVEPLSLTLTALRAECTAGTLNPVVWRIKGGTPPDTLTVDGAVVNADAERTTVTCGNLPAGATEAPGTIKASVTDAAGTTVTASAAYTIVPPLPAQSELGGPSLHALNWLKWDRGGVGGSPPTTGTWTSACRCQRYLVRWRSVGTDTWTTDSLVVNLSQAADGVIFYSLEGLDEGATYEIAIAKVRDKIEQETPGALMWSAPLLIAPISPLSGVEAIATHDTITINWDPPPVLERLDVRIREPRTHRSDQRGIIADDTIPDHIVFRDLRPDTWYPLHVIVGTPELAADAMMRVRTAAAPAEWTPLPRGPQNLRTTVTHDSVTVDWDAPYAGADDVYTVELTSREAQGAETATVSGGVTTNTFTGLAPATSYSVWVTHSDIVSEPVGVAIRTQARPAAPLRLTLSVERAECAAGASTRVSWTITGGTRPYTLTVAGEPVAADEGAATAPCGTGGPRQQTIEAHVTDATGAMASAVGTYIIVPPVAPPPPSARAAGVEALALTLTAVRSECTAGTRNLVTWEITGGSPPDTLTIDGEPVNADAESVSVTCGILPDDGVGELPITEAPGTITATVTDATGASATASAAYTIVPPLPAPTGLHHTNSIPAYVYTSWDDVPGVGELTLESAEGTPYTIDAYLVRYRVVGAPEWIHVLRETTVGNLWEVAAADIREFSVAALRHPLEQLTPAALRWSVAHPYAAVVAPQNLVATATHDTVTAHWDKQPHGDGGVVRLYGAAGGVSKRFPMATSAGRHSVTFDDLPPGTTYRVSVEYWLGSAQTEVTTLAPPPDYEPLPSGPQNLRATATHNSITVSWEASRPDDPLSYSVLVLHAASEIQVDVRDLAEGVTSVTLMGTFWRIQPDTLYEVVIYEDGIRGASAELLIRTPASPGPEGSSICFDYGVGPTICA